MNSEQIETDDGTTWTVVELPEPYEFFMESWTAGGNLLITCLDIRGTFEVVKGRLYLSDVDC